MVLVRGSSPREDTSGQVPRPAGWKHCCGLGSSVCWEAVFRIFVFHSLSTSARVLSGFNRVRLLVILWTVACRAALVHGILQARILEWVTAPSSRGSSDPGIELAPPALQVASLLLSHRGSPRHQEHLHLPKLRQPWHGQVSVVGAKPPLAEKH